MGLSTAPSSANDICSEIAEIRTSLGHLPTASALVDAARTLAASTHPTSVGNHDVEQLQSARKHLDAILQIAQAQLATLESDTNEDELKLEQLFRSKAWNDVQFAHTVFTYWLAWLDVEFAKRAPVGQQATAALDRAERGFRIASLHLSRSELVYGGLMGRGTVLLLRGHKRRAIKTFAALDHILSKQPTTDELEQLLLGVRVQRARLADAIDVSPTHEITAADMELFKQEVISLLHNGIMDGGSVQHIDARLRRLVGSNSLDAELLANLVRFGEQLAGLPIAPWHDLATAELRLRQQDYDNANRYYGRFFASSSLPVDLDLLRYRLNWAVAAYHVGAYQSAIQQLTEVTGHTDVSPRLSASAVKQLYVTHVAIESNSGSVDNRQALRSVAQKLVTDYPNDPDAPRVRAVLAQLVEDPSTALQLLENASNDAHTKELRFNFQMQRFNQLITAGEWMGLATLARQTLDVQRQLPSQILSEPRQTAFGVMLRAAANPGDAVHLTDLDALDFRIAAARSGQHLRNGEIGVARQIANEAVRAFQQFSAKNQEDPFNFELNAVLSTLDRLEEIEPIIRRLSPVQGYGHVEVARAAFWSRLHIYHSADKWREIINWFEHTSLDSPWQVGLLYPWVKRLKPGEDRLQIAYLLYTANREPAMDRRLRGVIIESLLAMARSKDAYDESHSFLAAHRRSGDAWRYLALSSAALGRLVEADKAWKVISDNHGPEHRTWWESTLSRIRIRANSTRPHQACPLLKTALRAQAKVPADLENEFTNIMDAGWCPSS